jgi:hypothetical protein
VHKLIDSVWRAGQSDEGISAANAFAQASHYLNGRANGESVLDRHSARENAKGGALLQVVQDGKMSAFDGVLEQPASNACVSALRGR